MTSIVLNYIKKPDVLFKGILRLFLALLIAACINLYTSNKSLKNSLQNANLNIEMYQNAIAGANELNNTLKLTVDDLKHTNDSILAKLNERVKKNTPNNANISTIATLVLTLYVRGDKGGLGGIDTLKNIYIVDSIRFNPETLVGYTIKLDSISITLDITNTQDLYIYRTKEWKNKGKNFFQRLFTFDWKKIWKELYKLVNSNDLIKTEDVRVVQITE